LYGVADGHVVAVPHNVKSLAHEPSGHATLLSGYVVGAAGHNADVAAHV